MAILAAIFANWMMLTCIFSLWFDATGNTAGNPLYSAALWVFGVQAFLSLIALSPVGERLLRFLSGCEEPTASEKRKIKPLAEEVLAAAKRNPAAYEFLISSDSFPNAFAIGAKTVCVSSGLLDGTSDAEIKGVLAHETWHHANGDGIRNVIFFANSLLWVGITMFCSKVCSVLDSLSALAGKPGSKERDLAGIIHFFTGIARIGLWLFSLIVWGPIFIGAFWGMRQSEYRADAFAEDIGYGDGLLRLLERVKKIGGPTGISGFLYKTHPSPRKRINRLEKRRLSNSACIQPPGKLASAFWGLTNLFRDKTVLRVYSSVALFCVFEYWMERFALAHSDIFTVWQIDDHVFEQLTLPWILHILWLLYILATCPVLCSAFDLFPSHAWIVGETLLLSGFASKHIFLLTRGYELTYLSWPYNGDFFIFNAADIATYLGLILCFYAFFDIFAKEFAWIRQP
jgi:heat shock protein HtpX